MSNVTIGINWPTSVGLHIRENIGKVNSIITHFNLFELQVSYSLLIWFQLYTVDCLQIIPFFLWQTMALERL
jgi:hypothetical protein